MYGGINRIDWRTVGLNDATLSDDEVRDRLLPVLRAADAGSWSSASSPRVGDCRRLLSVVLPLEPHEREFLDKLLDHGEVDPTLLTDELDLGERIKVQPGLLWKAANVRSFKGRG